LHRDLRDQHIAIAQGQILAILGELGRTVVALVVDAKLVRRDVVELGHLVRAHESEPAFLSRV